jgi:cell wall-associated NlpC family hydrolase
LVLREQFGVDIPEYAYLSADDADGITALVDYVRTIWELSPEEHPATGDLLLLRVLGEPIHVGVYLEGGYVLHTLKGHAAVLERIVPKWRNRIEGYGRWPS